MARLPMLEFQCVNTCIFSSPSSSSSFLFARSWNAHKQHMFVQTRMQVYEIIRLFFYCFFFEIKCVDKNIISFWLLLICFLCLSFFLRWSEIILCIQMQFHFAYDARERGREWKPRELIKWVRCGSLNLVMKFMIKHLFVSIMYNFDDESCALFGAYTTNTYACTHILWWLFAGWNVSLL